MADLVGRFMSAWNGALTAWSTYDVRALTPAHGYAYSPPYGELYTRFIRYNTARSYYYNTIYDSLNLLSTHVKSDERLYKFIRGIANPVKQENDLLVSYTYRGTIDTQTLKGGSIPLIYDNTALEEPTKLIMKWSNLDQQLSGYVRDAALLGDVAWWIVVDPFRQRVRMEQVDPARVKYVERDEVGNVRACVIEYERDEQPEVQRYQPGLNGLALQKTKTYLFTLKATKDWFETYKDGEAFAYYQDASGRPVWRWPNIYGFVPLKMAYYAMGKDGWGQNSFFGTARRQIDELNDQASILNDSVRNVVVPLLQALNVRKSSEITIEREDKDSMAIVYLSGDKAELKPVSIPLDLAAAIQNRNGLYAELVRNMPILALQQMRDIGGNLSGIAIQNMFGDAISVVENLRKNLNPPLVAAVQMGISMAAIHGFEGFGAFNERSFDAGDMEMQIADTPVIEDRLSKGEKVDKLVVVSGLPEGSKRKALAEMDYSAKDIDEMVAADKADAEEKTRQAVRAFSEGTFGDDSDDENEDVDSDDAPDAEETEADEEAANARPVAA